MKEGQSLKKKTKQKISPFSSGKFCPFLVLLEVLFKVKMLFAHHICLVSQTLLLTVLTEILHPSIKRSSMNTPESKMVIFGQNLSHYYVFLQSS